MLISTVLVQLISLWVNKLNLGPKYYTTSKPYHIDLNISLKNAEHYTSIYGK